MKFQEGIDADTDTTSPLVAVVGSESALGTPGAVLGPEARPVPPCLEPPRLFSACQGCHSWALTAAQLVSSVSEMCPGPLGAPYTSAVLMVCAPATPSPEGAGSKRDPGLSSTGRANDCTRLSLQRPPGCSRFVGVWPCPGTPAGLCSPRWAGAGRPGWQLRFFRFC